MRMINNTNCCHGDHVFIKLMRRTNKEFVAMVICTMQVWVGSKYLNAIVPSITDIQESILINGDPTWVNQFSFLVAQPAK